MDSKDKSIDELNKELVELRIAYDLLRAKCENGMIVLHKAEEKARQSEEKYIKAFMTSPDSVNINRLSDGMYVSVNEGFIKMLGFSEEEVIGKTSLELNIWADPDNRRELVSKLEKEYRVDNFEARFRHKNGSLIFGLMSASTIELEGILHSINITKDITSRKQIEDALLNEQFLVNALMDTLPDHVYFKDLESRFIRNSKSHTQSFGFDDPSQVKGKTDFDFFNKEDAQKAFEDEQTIIRSGQVIKKEEKFSRTDNSEVWFSAMKLPLRDKDGTIIGTFGISRDITEQKKAQEKLHLQANALKGVNECISITDKNNQVIFLNRAFIETYGYSEEDLKNESINLIRSPNNPPELVNDILPATLRGGWHGEIFNRKKDGTEFLISLSTGVVKDEKGEMVALIGIASDITKRKRTELENQILYEINRGITITSNLDELLKLIHLSLSKVVYADNFFIALMNDKSSLFNFPYFVDKFDTTPLPTSMGKSCSSYVYRTVRPFLFSQQEFERLENLGEVELVGSASPSWVGIPLQTPSKILGVMVLQHYEKENIYTEEDVKFLASIGGQIAFAIERKLAESEIKLKNELLQTVNSEKDKFFSILAHDLRGPLSAFVEATKIITEEVQNMSIEEIKDITLSMTQSATGIYSLLENLLEWSRLQRGVMNFTPEKLNIKSRFDVCISVLSESAKKKGIVIETSVNENLEINADKHMFDTIVRNLISNALKFTKSGGIVSISAFYQKENSIEIKISDTGIGMTPELINKLFRIDEKTSRPGTDGEPSTGLGLLLCKEFIEKHGGKIRVESEVGKGTTFAFILP
jgi:PAS domain S-box-containing protein